jgi:hypothetical protein
METMAKREMRVLTGNRTSVVQIIHSHFIVTEISRALDVLLVRKAQGRKKGKGVLQFGN